MTTLPENIQKILDKLNEVETLDFLEFIDSTPHVEEYFSEYLYKKFNWNPHADTETLREQYTTASDLIPEGYVVKNQRYWDIALGRFHSQRNRQNLIWNEIIRGGKTYFVYTIEDTGEIFSVNEYVDGMFVDDIPAKYWMKP